MNTTWFVAAWLLLDVCVSIWASRVANWVWREARYDLDAVDTADENETMRIVARLRCRNTGGIYAVQIVYMVSGILMLLSAILAFEAEARETRTLWMLVLFATSAISRLVAKMTLWWLSWSSRKDRLRLRAILGITASVARHVPMDEKCEPVE